MPVKFSHQQIIDASTDDTDDREVIPVAMPNDNRQRLLEKLGFGTFDARGEAHSYKGILIVEIKRVFDANQDKAHWKNPFVAIVAPTDVSALLAGIELYQGAQGEVSVNNNGWLKMSSPGYQC